MQQSHIQYESCPNCVDRNYAIFTVMFEPIIDRWVENFFDSYGKVL